MTNKPDLTLYLGGTRSGKSARAEAAAMRAKGPVLYVATAEARADDVSMLERIQRHRVRRPAHWHTLECPCHLAESIAAALALTPFAPKTAAEGGRVRPTILVDCVTLWISNILFNLPDPENLAAFEAAVRTEVDALLALADRSECRWLLVSGEIGLGGIASERIGRHYCDGLGLANQLIAARARDVFLVVAGRLLTLAE